MNKIMQLIRDNFKDHKKPMNLVKNESEARIYIYDIIDSYWGVSAKNVIDALNSVADAETLHIYINSPGGDVFEGRAIMAEIQRFKGKTIAHIDSLCASAATSIALACNEVKMSEGAFFMIHNASGLAWGDKSVLRETADLLEKVEGSIVADYVNKTGKEAAEIIAWMDDETWFTAQEALDNGFIDEITKANATSNKTKNTWNLSAFEKAPKNLAEIESPVEVENLDPQEIETAPAGFLMAAANNNKLNLALAL